MPNTYCDGLLRRLNTILAVGLILSISSAVRAQPALQSAPKTVATSAPHEPSDKVDERISALIRKMSLAEKIGQMHQSNNVDTNARANSDPQRAQDSLIALIRQGEVGSVLNEVNPANINRLQKVAVEESRLGVPLIFGRDVIHGFRTMFPIPLGQAASWNPKLVEQAAEVAGREARSVGIHWTFAPMVDIARDPRWGRIAESLGEDPYLASALSAAMVHGFQGNDLSSPDRIAACAKHFVGYGACEGGRDYNSAVISGASMRNVYLPPFRAAVDAGVATLMTSFNDVNAVPGSANRQLRSVLRDEWGFRGFVVSDWESIREMIVHGYCRDDKEAARAAVQAGVNMEMVSVTYKDNLQSLIHGREILETSIDELVSDILRLKFRLGLFEHPFTNEGRTLSLTDEHLEVAHRLARQSVVLLKNKNGLLPLDRTKVRKLAIVGPLADAKKAQLGTWALDGRETDSRTPLDAIRKSAGSETEVLFAEGLANDLDRSKSKFEEAVATAKKADAVLLIVGESADLSGEARSRAILDLPGAQNALVEAIAATGKPVVLIVEAGRPLTIGAQIERVDAVLYSFHAGTMAGPALADLVWGGESPSGKLPVTFPKTVGQIPLYYNHMKTGRPPRPYDFRRDNQLDDHINLDLGNTSNYLDVSPYPLYPFGFGLSYATFEYSNVKLSSPTLSKGATLIVSANVTNTGKLAADEIAQLYVRNTASGAIHPVRELKGFQRLHIEPGATKTVEFSLPFDSLVFFDSQERRTNPSGTFEIYMGGDSTAPLAAKFIVKD